MLALTELEGRHVPGGTPAADLPIVPEIAAAMQTRLRDVASLGRSRGLRDDVVAKAGDSITAGWSRFLIPLGEASYNPFASGLATQYPELLPTWGKYRAPADAFGNNSYTRTSLSAYPGWQSGDVARTAASEVAATRAGVALVMVGTNDATHGDIFLFRSNLRALVQTYLDLGVVPVLSTVPENTTNDNFPKWTRAVNEAVADVADELLVPVWNYHRGLDALPGYGLADNVHPAADPTGGGLFVGAGLSYGTNVRNLEALQVLEKVNRVVFGGGAPDAPPPSSAGESFPPGAPGEAVLAAGAALGEAPEVRLLDSQTGAERGRFLAYESTFLGGVNVAVGDVDGDGVADVVTSPGRGGGPVVTARSGADGRELFRFYAFEEGFRGGVTLALADFDGDGAAELVLGTGAGGGPRVKVVSATTGATLGDFLAFGATFRGGVNVAAGDFGGAVGRAVAATPGPGGGGGVQFFRPDGTFAGSVDAFEPVYRGGVNLAAGDLDGDGVAELALGAAQGATRVRVVDAAGVERASFDPGGRARSGAVVAIVPGAVVAGTSGRAGTLSARAPGGTRLWALDEDEAGPLGGGASNGSPATAVAGS